MNPKKRKAQSASILTSSPYKNQLIEQERKKEENGKRQLKTKSKQPRNKCIRKSKIKIILQIHNDSESDEEEWHCIVCGDIFAESTPGESWVQYQSCQKWAHDQCASGLPYFICPNCVSD